MSIFEWLSILSSVLVFIFGAGILYNRYINTDKEVLQHDSVINILTISVDKLTSKVNLIEAENTKNTTNIHKMANELNSFKINSDKKQTVTLMLLDQLCKHEVINTEMAKFLMD